MDEFLSKNPALQGMDPQKLKFLMNFARQDKPNNMNAAMPFLLANMKQAKKENIHFTNSEVQLITEILTKDFSPEEKNKVKKIMSMMGR